jgi:predicted flavoprotein YhiN
MSKSLIVVGGGAAGFFCAVNASRMCPGLETTILEKSSKLLSKVRVSGGGRCNVTHACFSVEELIRRYPRGSHFLKKSFYHFSPADTIRWFEERGVRLKTEPDGRMFPLTDRSQTIIDCLLKEADRWQVRVALQQEVKKIEIVEQDGGPDQEPEAGKGGDHQPGSSVGAGQESPSRKFRIHLSPSGFQESDYVCLATGGDPKARMTDLLTELGHSAEPPVPSLFTFNMPGNAVTNLSGISVPDAHVKIAGTRLIQRGPLLITHWGMSGPVILRLSAWGARELSSMAYQFTTIVNWIPEYNENSLREKLQTFRSAQGSQKTGSRNFFGLPARLWEYLLSRSGIDVNTRWSDLPSGQQHQLTRNLVSAEFPVEGKTTFKEEFVTAGGIRLSEIDPHTMQSKKVPGMYLAGEIMDVDGITGGFNFQHAWTSGYLAARSIALEAQRIETAACLKA